MRLTNRKTISLIVLSLFIVAIACANSALAGKGGTPNDQNLQQQLLLLQSRQNSNSNR
jgi:hypothetical protein